MPGQFPFTRGIHPAMYSTRLWTMRQYSGFATAETSNERFRYLLSQGQTGLSVAFDLPTQIGLDPDHRLARGEVGRTGVSIATCKDMERLLKDIPLAKTSLSMTINATAIVLLCFWIAEARRRRIAPAKLAGTLQNDILKEFAARGTYAFAPSPSMRLCTDIIEYCTREMPRVHPISISGYHMREAGASAAQELAFTMANAAEYVRWLRSRGIPFDRFGSKLSFFFGVHNDFFEEIAKFRAARGFWADLAKKRFGARKAGGMKMRFHAQTCGSTLTHQIPKNNLTRVTYQALAAVLGGTQSLHTNAWDEAIGLPTAESAKTALRIQQILAHETGIPGVVDPLGGSYFMESLTAQIRRKAYRIFRGIEAEGGALAAIENQSMQAAIRQNAYAQQKAVDSGAVRVIGIAASKRAMRSGAPGSRVSHRRHEQTQRRLVQRHRRRTRGRVGRVLERLRESAAGKENLVEPVLRAVHAEATMGEICGALREVFGEYET